MATTNCQCQTGSSQPTPIQEENPVDAVAVIVVAVVVVAVVVVVAAASWPYWQLLLFAVVTLSVGF